jgi:hypothetical protein
MVGLADYLQSMSSEILHNQSLLQQALGHWLRSVGGVTRWLLAKPCYTGDRVEVTRCF